jgi:hypothetical protein
MLLDSKPRSRNSKLYQRFGTWCVVVDEKVIAWKHYYYGPIKPPLRWGTSILHQHKHAKQDAAAPQTVPSEWDPYHPERGGRLPDSFGQRKILAAMRARRIMDPDKRRQHLIRAGLLPPSAKTRVQA